MPLLFKRFQGTKDDSLAARWRRGPPSDAVEILELERQKELEMWAEFRRNNEDIGHRHGWVRGGR